MVNVTVGYNGRDEKSSDGVSFSAVGAGNVEISEADAVASDELDTFVDVFKGGTTSGNIVFAVPVADAPTLQVYAQAFASFDGDDVFFALR